MRNTTTGEKKPEMPPGKKPSKATASFWTDQGSVGMAGINFLLFHLGYFIWYFPDMSHRVWNDLKAAFKKAGTWRCVTYLTLVFNLNYKPFGKGAWMEKKKTRWQTWINSVTIDDPRFLKYAADIAEDLGMGSPQTEADYEAILAEIKKMKSFQIAGPSTKLMRWFSWFESWAKIYKREMRAIKMILEEIIEDTDDADQAEEDDHQTEQHSDPRKDLSELKRMYGNFKTAYKVITAEIVWEANMLSKCVAPIWSCNTDRLRETSTPRDNLQHDIKMHTGGWWKEIADVLDATLRSDAVCKDLGLFEGGEVAERRLHKFFTQAMGAPWAPPPPPLSLSPPSPQCG